MYVVNIMLTLTSKLPSRRLYLCGILQGKLVFQSINFGIIIKMI